MLEISLLMSCAMGFNQAPTTLEAVASRDCASRSSAVSRSRFRRTASTADSCTGYLDFTVPPRLGKPITLRQLMTHTTGFAETYKELMTPDKASTPTLEQYVKRHLPKRIYAPGTTVAYSNYGGTLAGYIVQRVSGERFEDYVARHIFGPLGMRRSSFEQPPRAEGRVATGYIAGSGPAYPFEFAGDVPAGGLPGKRPDVRGYGRSDDWGCREIDHRIRNIGPVQAFL